MRRLFVLLALALTGCGALSSTETVGTHLWHSLTGQCGIERWATKTLTDSRAGDVALSPVYNATIAGFTQRPAPPILSGFSSPRDYQGKAPWELHVFRLTGKVIYAKHEADQDVHLALEDPAGHTMIVESTYPGCAQGSRVASQMVAVRSFVDANFQSLVGSTVTVIGVGFSDFVHGQTGVAPNAIELHPLTAIKFAQPVQAPALHLRSNPD